MTKLHLYASGDTMPGVLDWLAAACRIAPSDLASTISYPDSAGCPLGTLSDVPAITIPDAATHVGADDAVIVAGPDFGRTVGDLLGLGIRNIYNGNEMIRRHTAARRFVEAAAAFFVGPTTPTCDGAAVPAAGRFTVEPVAARQVPRHKLFIVNSMPKSGTIWMTAMLEDLLGVRAEHQITVSHVADIEEDWNKENNHGAVTLVRDLRDVVVSWFHQAMRADRAIGFAAPRYPDIATFYNEFFVGTMLGTARFYHGNLEHWLNLVSAHYVPIIRYEDMIADTEACLRKVATFWRIEVSPELLRQVIHDHAFASIEQTVRDRSGFVADIVNQGHVRRGRPGSWRDEMPADVASDINERFAGYQRRLGYWRP